jgi:hypothetical protein
VSLHGSMSAAQPVVAAGRAVSTASLLLLEIGECLNPFLASPEVAGLVGARIGRQSYPGG